MYSFLKYTHLSFVLLAVLLLIARFYWMQTGHKNDQINIFKKITLHTNLTIILLGVILMGYLQINPFISNNYWLLEKMLGFAAFIVMVNVALNNEKMKGIQYLAFAGSLGWLAYIGQLAVSKQAILLVG